MDGDLSVIIPTYGHIDYAAAALESLFRSTPRAWACLVDDASPQWESHHAQWIAPLEERFRDQLMVIRYDENGGLTRSWNRGLAEARSHGALYTCCTNSDVLFTSGWEASLLTALDTDTFALLGPLSNAPGNTARGLQDVGRYFSGYRVTDNHDYLDRVARMLKQKHEGAVLSATVNGFCMMARTERWWSGAFDDAHVFDPCPKYRISGNEDELQRRWHASGWATGVVPASFVFHYRAVTRGDRFKRGKWFRRPAASRTRA